MKRLYAGETGYISSAVRRQSQARTVMPRAWSTPRFSWSWSRDRVLRECARRYYWHYYGSFGGWRSGASEEARVA